MIDLIIIAIVGILESFISTIYSKFRQRSNYLYTAISGLIYNITWFYMLSRVIENIKNIKLIAIYIIFCMIGDLLGLKFDIYLEKLAKFKGIKIKKHKIIKRKGRR
ncbi:MAG: hypothetical protein V1901_04380 [Patescibacteria group bacterium]